MGTLIQIRN